MKYEQKYKIAKAALDKLQVAFDDLSKAHEEMREAYNLEIKTLNHIIDIQDEKISRFSEEISVYKGRILALEILQNCERLTKLKEDIISSADTTNKTWWQKLKESIFRPAK